MTTFKSKSKSTKTHVVFGIQDIIDTLKQLPEYQDEKFCFYPWKFPYFKCDAVVVQFVTQSEGDRPEAWEIHCTEQGYERRVIDTTKDIVLSSLGVEHNNLLKDYFKTEIINVKTTSWDQAGGDVLVLGTTGFKVLNGWSQLSSYGWDLKDNGWLSADVFGENETLN